MLLGACSIFIKPNHPPAIMSCSSSTSRSRSPRSSSSSRSRSPPRQQRRESKREEKRQYQPVRHDRRQQQESRPKPRRQSGGSTGSVGECRSSRDGRLLFESKESHAKSQARRPRAASPAHRHLKAALRSARLHNGDEKKVQAKRDLEEQYVVIDDAQVKQDKQEKESRELPGYVSKFLERANKAQWASILALLPLVTK